MNNKKRVSIGSDLVFHEIPAVHLGVFIQIWYLQEKWTTLFISNLNDTIDWRIK